MAIRVPRGFEVSRPYYNELCEGVRPVAGATAKEAWTGLAMTRVDEQHHDPIVLEPGTLVGMVTGGNAIAEGKMTPAVMGTGASDAGNLSQFGSSNAWTLPIGAQAAAVGRVKPIGVCYQPIYSFILQDLYTNYTRNTAVGVVTDYVIQIPALNTDEWAIEPGDAIMLGEGKNHGIGYVGPLANGTNPTHAAGTHLAGRYAAVKNFGAGSYGAPYVDNDLHDRVVGRCLKKIKLGNTTSAVGTMLADDLANFTIDPAATTEYAHLAKIQTVPGLPLSGSGTKGIPGFFLGARADANGDYWGMTLLIRL